MLSWLAKRMIARNMAKAREGDIGPTLKMDAEDVRFREYEVYEDTQKAKALDGYLASVGKL